MALLALCAVLLLVLPLVALVWRGVLFGQGVLGTPGIAEALVLSLGTTALSLGLSLVLGTPLAFVLAKWHFPLRSAVNLLVELPIVLPPAVAGLALLIAFGRRGLFGGALADVGVSLPFTTAAVVLAQTFVAMPFYVRTAVVGFGAVPTTLEDAARVDGADERALFWRITLPLAGRALLAGAVLCWARALGEFGATLIFAGSLRGRTQTMPLLIYSVLERDVNAAVATGGMLLLGALMALALSRWLMGWRTDASAVQP